MKERLVSVVMITYNQSQFITEAICGVIKQIYSGDIELIIVDDCSRDNTAEIIRKTLSSFDIPQNIQVKYNRNATNKGVVPNFVYALNKASGDYIAMCEGDDYWTDPLKLQKQVDFLKENKDCNLVYHRVMIFDEESKVFFKENLNSEDIQTKRTLETLTLSGNFMHTPSVVFRNNIDVQSKLFEGNVGDYILWFLNGEKGLYGYLPDYMAVYRVWKGGVWSGKKKSVTHFNFAKILLRLRKDVQSTQIRKNLKLQAIDNLLSIGFSDLTFKDRFKFSILMLRVEPTLIWNLIKKTLSFIKN